MKKYDEYGIEQESVNITPYIILGIIAFFVLIGIVILIFNLGNIKNFFFPKNEEQKTEEKNNNDVDEIKLVDGLIEPEISLKSLIDYEYLKVELTDVEASSKGYTLSIEAKSNTNDEYKIKCSRIVIDGYDIDGEFTIILGPHETKSTTVLLKKTDLEELEINNFVILGFTFDLTSNGETKGDYGSARMLEKLDVDNEKKGLIKIDEYDKLNISYYKKIEDNTNTYLYFDIENNSSYNYNITLNRFFINGQIYEEDFNIKSIKQGEKIFYIKVPKKDIETIESIKISFFSEKELKDNKTGYEIRITPEKEITT